MRNPVRLKNLRLRFLPLYLAGAALLLWLPPRREALLAGALPVLLGLLLRSWGSGHLVKTEILTTSGPYAYLRHPLYAGTLLIASGFALMLGGVMTLVLLLGLWPWFAWGYFPRKEASEAARLAARHAERYAAYRSAVPALLPRWPGWREAGSSGGRRRWALDRYSQNNELGTLLAVTGGLLVLWLRAVDVAS